MSQAEYVSGINLTDKRRQPIPAGVVFYKEDIVENTFDSLEEAGDITVYVPGDQQAIVTHSSSRSLGGPLNKTPSAAINPKKRGPEMLTDAELFEKREIVEKLGKLKIKVVHNMKLTTLRKKLAEAVADTPASAKSETKTETAPKKKPARIWDMSEEDAKTMPVEQLYAKYAEKCKEFELTADENLSEEAVRAKMCSETNL